MVKGLLKVDGLLLTVPGGIHRTTGDRSFSYSALKLWNNLPIEIRRIKELSSFKSAIKSLFFNEAYSQSPFVNSYVSLNMLIDFGTSKTHFIVVVR